MIDAPSSAYYALIVLDRLTAREGDGRCCVLRRVRHEDAEAVALTDKLVSG